MLLRTGLTNPDKPLQISHFENYADVALGYGGGDLEPWRKVGMIKGIVAFTFLHEVTMLPPSPLLHFSVPLLTLET